MIALGDIYLLVVDIWVFPFLVFSVADTNFQLLPSRSHAPSTECGPSVSSLASLLERWVTLGQVWHMAWPQLLQDSPPSYVLRYHHSVRILESLYPYARFSLRHTFPPDYIVSTSKISDFSSTKSHKSQKGSIICVSLLFSPAILPSFHLTSDWKFKNRWWRSHRVFVFSHQSEKLFVYLENVIAHVFLWIFRRDHRHWVMLLKSLLGCVGIL